MPESTIRRWLPEHDAQLSLRYSQGWSVNEIAHDMGFKPEEIKFVLRREGRLSDIAENSREALEDTQFVLRRVGGIAVSTLLELMGEGNHPETRRKAAADVLGGIAKLQERKDVLERVANPTFNLELNIHNGADEESELEVLEHALSSYHPN